MTLTDLRLRLRALVFRGRAERELLEELEFHREMQHRTLRATGLDDADATRRSRARFGSTALVADECRDARGIGWFETLFQDARYALRSFRRAPMFALTVVATISLGLGLNTAVFTIFNAYVLKPFAVRDPYSLYSFEYQSAGRFHRVTWNQYEELRRDNRIFTEMFAQRRQLITRIEGHTAFALLVTGNYFRMLGIDAAIGRTLEPSDTATPGAPAVVVISHAVWQQHFGGDPRIVGRKILVQGHPCEVVGVAREGFVGLDFSPSHDIWLPITLQHQLEDGADLFAPNSPATVDVIGRLDPAVTTRTAEAALLVWAKAATRTLPEEDRATNVWLESRSSSIPLTPMVFFALSPIAAAFGLVLLIACANVANMMLARGMARQREIGIRLTLGAARRRLVRQLVTESVMLAVPAGLLGFVVSRLAIDASVRAMFATLPSEFTEFVRVAPLPPDTRVLAFMVIVAVLTGVAFGLAPALQTTRSNIVQMARGDFGSDYGPWRLRNALVVGQITASVALLITATVLVRSAQHVARIDPGLRTRDVVTIDARDEARPRLAAALQASPIVSLIASASTIPLDATAPEVGATVSPGGDLVRIRYRYVSSSYFDLFDLPVLSGRTFTPDEARAGAPVAIVSASAAARLWPGASPVGQALHLVPDRRTAATARIRRFETVQVVGVSRDYAADLGNSGPMTAAIHFPADVNAPGSGLIVRVIGEPEAARRALTITLDAAAPGAVQQIHKLQEFVAGRLYPFRAAYAVAAAVGLLALLLTITGVYGVVSYLVTQRAKEISIRFALGADVGKIVTLVVRHSLRLAWLGLCAGTLIALGGARIFGWRVMMLKAFDPFSYVAGILVVVVACVVASCVPAFRASKIDPMQMLRAD